MADLWPDLGKYTFAVLSSYGVGLGGILGLIAWSMRANAKTRAELDALEKRGGPRR
ncbi:heme exporter protein CcmD [Rhodovulum sp. DZ06]|uniref:heme exporter protein CcmD n=1 Tax=Rhodovulum sp. DZ06 TaxID=3425126 RepID=UPI003D32DD81